MLKAVAFLTPLVALALCGGHPVWPATAVAPGDDLTAGAENLAIIVNKSNPVTSLSFAELRRIFMVERTHWPDGRKIVLVMREPGQPERAAVLRSICRMTEAEYRRYLLHLSFTGQLQSEPKSVSTGSAMRRFVVWVPGALGYVRASELDGSVKVVRIDGRAPGENGYKLTLAPK